LAQKLHECRSNADNAYGVAALWPVQREAAETFAQIAETNAVASVRLEIGCQAFGVFRSLKDPTVFALIEVFDDADSFSDHLKTDHFREFGEFAKPQYLGDRSQTLKGIATWI
jgi:quinol monooxygenase YgiN